MRRLLFLIVMVSLLFWGNPDRGHAYSVGFSPSSTFYATNGSTYSIDIVVSGLLSGNQIVSAYNLDILYNPALLSFSSVSYTTSLGDPSWFEVLQGTRLSSGRVNIASVSLLSDADLVALQHAMPGVDTVTLATLNFSAIGNGPISLAFDWFPGRDIKGLLNQILIDSSHAVPEPATLVLLGSGLLSFLGLGRKRRLSAKSAPVDNNPGC